MKKFFEIFLLIILSLLFSYFEVPIRVGDLIAIGLSGIMIILALHILKSEDKVFYIESGKDRGLKFRLLTWIATMLVILLSVVMLLIGISDPLKISYSIKGHFHGYSIFIMGVSTLFIVGSMIYDFFSSKNV